MKNILRKIIKYFKPLDKKYTCKMVDVCGNKGNYCELCKYYIK